MSKQQLLVVGNGMVGHHFIEQLVNAGGLEQYEVTVFGAEPDSAYDRVHLSEVFGGKAPKELQLADPEWYAEKGVKLLLSSAIEGLDLEAKTVTTCHGEQYRYDQLVLATGSYPFVPPIPGHLRAGCYVYRTLSDLDAIRDACAGGRTGVVVGGACWGSKPLTPCACWGWKPMWWSSPRV